MRRLRRRRPAAARAERGLAWQVVYLDVESVKLALHDDHTGSLLLRSKHADALLHAVPVAGELMPSPEVQLDHVFDIKGACKVLDAVLPREVVEAAGLAGASGK